MTTLLQHTEITKDFAQNTVENMVSTVQNVHHVITNACFHLLDQATGGKNRLETLKENHDAIVDRVYDSIQSINRYLGNLASDLFGNLEDGKLAARALADKPADTTANAKTQKPTA